MHRFFPVKISLNTHFFIWETCIDLNFHWRHINGPSKLWGRNLIECFILFSTFFIYFRKAVFERYEIFLYPLKIAACFHPKIITYLWYGRKDLNAIVFLHLLSLQNTFLFSYFCCSPRQINLNWGLFSPISYLLTRLGPNKLQFLKLLFITNSGSYVCFDKAQNAMWRHS